MKFLYYLFRLNRAFKMQMTSLHTLSRWKPNPLLSGTWERIQIKTHFLVVPFPMPRSRTGEKRNQLKTTFKRQINKTTYFKVD